MKALVLPLIITMTLGACAAPGQSVGDYAIGDDNAAINVGRNRKEAQLTRAQLEQHRRQRANVSEELALEREKRANKHDSIRQGMGTAAGAVGLIGGVAGIVRAFR